MAYKNPQILVVDDDENVLDILSMYLKKENFRVLTADDGIKALKKIDKEEPDLVILDIMMPEMNGKEVIKNIRNEKQIPVIFLSARSEEFDRILGLELGADDYVTKPFSPKEVVTRVKVILKRVNQDKQIQTIEKNILKFSDLKINPQKREVKVKEEIIKLSPKEYDILLVLSKNPGQVFPRERLYEIVWGEESYGDLRSVDVHINWLRKKINLGYIKTVWGVGYKFENKGSN